MALYHLYGLPGVKICQTQIALRWTMPTKVRGDHTERLATATEKGRELHCPKTGRGGNWAVRLKIGVSQNILNDDAFASSQSAPPGRLRLRAHC